MPRNKKKKAEEVLAAGGGADATAAPIEAGKGVPVVPAAAGAAVAKDLAKKYLADSFERKKTQIIGAGQGLFAKCAIKKGDVIFKKAPACSVIFDPYVKSVCSYCYVTVEDFAKRNYA